MSRTLLTDQELGPYQWGIKNWLPEEYAVRDYAAYLSELYFTRGSYRAQQFVDVFCQLFLPMIAGVHRPAVVKVHDQGKYENAARTALQGVQGMYLAADEITNRRLQTIINHRIQGLLDGAKQPKAARENRLQIMDWLLFSVEQQSDWLHQRTENGTYARLTHMRLNPQMVARVANDEYSGFRIKKGLLRGQDYTFEDAAARQVLGLDGSRFVLLKSVAALNAVAEHLDNCIHRYTPEVRAGQINYEKELAMGEACFYALCRKDGKPLALIRIKYGTVLEVGGLNVINDGQRYNLFPVEHMPLIRNFIRVNGFKISKHSSQTGFVQAGGQVKSIFDIGPDDRMDDTLDLRRVNQHVNVEGMHIQGDFDMTGTRWMEVPAVRAEQIWAIDCPNLNAISDGATATVLHVNKLVKHPSPYARISRVYFYQREPLLRTKSDEMSYADYCERCWAANAYDRRQALLHPPRTREYRR